MKAQQGRTSCQIHEGKLKQLVMQGTLDGTHKNLSQQLQGNMFVKGQTQCVVRQDCEIGTWARLACFVCASGQLWLHLRHVLMLEPRKVEGLLPQPVMEQQTVESQSQLLLQIRTLLVMRHSVMQQVPVWSWMHPSLQLHGSQWM